MKTVIAALVASAALRVVPAGALAANTSDGAGQAFGRHHGEMARAGMLGVGMDPGHHVGSSCWERH